jgi:hypothetical protein
MADQAITPGTRVSNSMRTRPDMACLFVPLMSIVNVAIPQYDKSRANLIVPLWVSVDISSRSHQYHTRCPMPISSWPCKALSHAADGHDFRDQLIFCAATSLGGLVFWRALCKASAAADCCPPVPAPSARSRRSLVIGQATLPALASHIRHLGPTPGGYSRRLVVDFLHQLAAGNCRSAWLGDVPDSEQCAKGV